MVIAKSENWCLFCQEIKKAGVASLFWYKFTNKFLFLLKQAVKKLLNSVLMAHITIFGVLNSTYYPIPQREVSVFIYDMELRLGLSPRSKATNDSITFFTWLITNLQIRNVLLMTPYDKFHDVISTLHLSSETV